MSRRHAAGEIALFVVAASIGNLGLGESFRGHAAWLAVTAVAVFVLARQMGRVQDTLPRCNQPSQPPGPRSSSRQPNGEARRTASPGQRDGEHT